MFLLYSKFHGLLKLIFHTNKYNGALQQCNTLFTFLHETALLCGVAVICYFVILPFGHIGAILQFGPKPLGKIGGSQLGSHDEALIGHHIYMTEQSQGSFT